MDKVLVTRRHTGGRPNKLTEKDKDRIVTNYNCGDTQRELAAQYNVSVSTIRRVLRERSMEIE